MLLELVLPPVLSVLLAATSQPQDRPVASFALQVKAQPLEPPLAPPVQQASTLDTVKAPVPIAQQEQLQFLDPLQAPVAQTVQPENTRQPVQHAQTV